MPRPSSSIIPLLACSLLALLVCHPKAEPAGQKETGAIGHPVAPRRYRLTRLPMDTAADVNNHGAVIGCEDSAEGYNDVPILWQDGKRRVLGKDPFILPQEDEVESASALPEAIDDRGRITGTVTRVVSGAITVTQEAPFIWEKGRMREGTLPIGRLRNRRGQRIGSEDIGKPTFETERGYASPTGWEYSDKGLRYRHAVLYKNGRRRDLGTLPGGDWSIATAINDQGQVVGMSLRTGGERRAFLWENGRMRDLGGLPGFPESHAFDINNKGQVVGYAWRREGVLEKRRAFIWEGGRMYDLIELALAEGKTPRASDFALTEARAINERGQIVGDSTDHRAFLLTPEPEKAGASTTPK